MRRRDLLGAIGAVIASPIVATRTASQPAPGSRAAVVIGVNKAGNLPVLKAAVLGARLVANWLHKNGFEVKTFLDDDGPVRAFDVQRAIAELVERGTLTQLVIYFAGHGFLNAGRSEIWMLSGAPANSSEAINVESSINDARETGIPNIVFVSDACRSTPLSLDSARVQGYLIFPNLGVTRNVRPDIDRFFAALPGDPSYEVQVSESASKWEGIYTTALLDAFTSPDAKMVRTIHGQRVIPNRMLKPYLWMEVPKRAQQKKIALNQIPETIVESDETVYVGRVHSEELTDVAKTKITIFAPLAAPMILRYTAETQLKLVGANFLEPGLEISTTQMSKPFSLDFIKWQSQVQQEHDFPFIESGAGISVVGAELENVVTNRRMRAERLPGDGMRQNIRVDTIGQPGGSVALQFAGGSGTVVAALQDFVATVFVENGRVTNVNYLPRPSTARWYESMPTSRELQRTRAAIAASTRAGIFRLEGDRDTRTRQAAELANRIKVARGLDPTLAVYAAYACSDADIGPQIQSIREAMRRDLGVDFFDIAMLAGALTGSESTPVPFCPMISRGSNLLRGRNVRLAPIVQQALDNILPSLWTTFDKDGINRLSGALAAGDLF